MLKAIKPKQNCSERMRMHDGSGSQYCVKSNIYRMTVSFRKARGRGAGAKAERVVAVLKLPNTDESPTQTRISTV